jgi:hypothetical protein
VLPGLESSRRRRTGPDSPKQRPFIAFLELIKERKNTGKEKEWITNQNQNAISYTGPQCHKALINANHRSKNK